MIKNKIHIAFLFAYSFLMTYLHSFNSVRFTDEAIYSDNAVFYLMGKAMLEGKVLYKDMFDHKTPYVYFINALASIFDKNHVGLYIITSLVLFVSLYFTYKIVELFLKDKILSIVAAATICLFLNTANFTLGFLRTEGYAISLILPSAYLFIKYFLSDDIYFPMRKMYLIGILAGITLLINVKAVVLFVPFAIATLVVLIKNKNYENIFLCFVSGLAGVVIAILPAIIYIVKNDCVGESIDAIFRVNTIYSNYDSAVNAFHETKLETILMAIKMHPLITILILIELVSIILYKTKNTIKISVFTSFILCLGYTVLFNRPYTYYYTIIIPYLIPVFLIVVSILCRSEYYPHESMGESTRRGRHTVVPRNYIFPLIAILILFAINFPLGYSVINKRYDSNRLANTLLHEKLDQVIKVDENTKVLSFGFSPEYYMFLNQNISFKYFIIPNIKFEYYSEPYLKQIDYVRKSLPDVLIFSFGDYTTQLPKEYFNEFRNVVDSNYKYLGDLNIFIDTTKNPKVLVRK